MLSVYLPFELLKQMTDFHEILYECMPLEATPTSYISVFSNQ
jgi:hypothetical protein